jgi:MFS superfamily sulfate permease-like transporter
LIYVATVVGIVTVDLLTGVAIGFGLTVAQILWNATRFHVDVREDSSRSRADVHLKGLATFICLPKLAQALDGVPVRSKVHLHIQDLYHIDHTCLDLLKATAEQREAQGGRLEVHWEELSIRYHLHHIDRARLDKAA